MSEFKTDRQNTNWLRPDAPEEEIDSEEDLPEEERGE